MSYLYTSGTVAPANDNAVAVGEEIMSRDVAAAALTLATGSLKLRWFTARKTEVVSQVRVECSNVAAGATPTLVRMGVWAVDPADALGLTSLLAATPNDTALLAAAYTQYTKAFSVPLQKAAGTRYCFGILVVTAATAPNVYASNSAPSTLRPRLNAALGGQSDLPATVSSAVAGGAGPNGSGPFAILLP